MNLLKRLLWSAAFVGGLGAATWGAWSQSRWKGSWVMLNSTYDSQQGDAHLLRFSDRQTILIDAGWDGGRLLNELGAVRVRRLGKVIITHPHKDHYQGLRAVIEKGIPVGEVIFNRPLPVVCDQEIPWGCDRADVDSLVGVLAAAKVPVRGAAAGDLLWESGSDRLEVLHAYDGRETPVGPTDVNDTSLILRLSLGPWKVLFTGDLNHRLGSWLAERPEEVVAHLLQVPHHGLEGTAPDPFFGAVDPLGGLVSVPRALWETPRAARVRRWFGDRARPLWSTGENGRVSVQFHEDRVDVEPAEGAAARFRFPSNS